MEEIKYFFSYARKDSEFVLKLAKELRAIGANLWLDQLDILGGQRWDHAVEGALKICQGMIVVLSPESLASNNVMDEVSYALEKEKLVVPILFRSCDIPFRLRRVQHIDFTIDYDMGFSQLLKALGIEQSLGKADALEPAKRSAQEIDKPLGETQIEAERKPPSAHLPNERPERREREKPPQPKESAVRRWRLTYAVYGLVLILLAGGGYWGYRKWRPEGAGPDGTQKFDCLITDEIGTVNLREGPSASAPTVKGELLQPGEKVDVTEWCYDLKRPGVRWLHIAAANDRKGWIISRPYPDRNWDYKCNFDVRAAAFPFPENCPISRKP